MFFLGLSLIEIVSAIGTAISAVGAIKSGMASSAQAKAQQAALSQQAAREREVAAADEATFRQRQARLLASRRAMLGGSGVSIGEGSPLLVSEDIAGETELQALRIRAGGATTATRLEQQGTLERFRGRADRSSGFMRAGSLLLSGAAQAGFGR